MSVLGRVHERAVFGRRVERLAELLAAALPPSASVLDIGCGDGSVAAAILSLRPDLRIEGVDVLVRPHTHIPVTRFDGTTLPHDTDSFDVALFVDVLHHTDDASTMIAEAARVAPTLVVKDHLRDSATAETTLRAMDWVGNRHHGVRLPYNYLSTAQWQARLGGAGLDIETWQTRLGIYHPSISWLFDRQLHVLFTARRSAASDQ